MKIFASLVFLVFSSLATSQNQTGSVEGIVRRKSDLLPMDNARVSLVPAQGRTLSIVTDGNGLFALQGIPAGTYKLQAGRDGYEDANSTRTVTIGLGENVRGIAIGLSQLGAINGRILDQIGQPIFGIAVETVQLRYTEGRAELVRILATRTDSRGDYRLFGLSSGEYYIRAVPSVTNTLPGENPKVTTYFPSVPDLNVAIVVPLKEGEDVAAINITIIAPPSFRVRGRIVNPPNDIAAFPSPLFTRLQLVRFGRDGVHETRDVSMSVDSATGNFSLERVLPGTYELVVRRVPLGNRSNQALNSPGTQEASSFLRYGRARFEVVPDTPEVAIVLGSLGSVKGRISLSGSPAVVGVVASADVAFVPVSTFPMEVAAERLETRVNRTGEIGVRNLVPGTYHVIVSGLPSGTYVKDVKQGGRSVFDTGVNIQSGVEALIEVVLSRPGSSVSGIVRDAQERSVARSWVVLIPSTNRRQNPALYFTTKSDDKGNFSFAGIVPGPYTVFAWESDPQGAYFDSKFLSRVEQRGFAIAADEGIQATASVRVIGR